MIIYYSGNPHHHWAAERTEVVSVMMSYTFAYGKEKNTLKKVRRIIRRRNRQKKQQ